MKQIALIISIFILSACSNPLNLITGRRYFIQGLESVKSGDMFTARMAFGRAWMNANWGHEQEGITAVYAYNYGRASGAICDWVEAERGLLKAYELDQKTKGPLHMSLIELGFMYKAQGAIEKAEKYFNLGKKEADKQHIVTKDPIGYATFLSEYAEVLSLLKKPKEAIRLKNRSEEIKHVFKENSSNKKPIPYGKFCRQNPQK